MKYTKIRIEIILSFRDFSMKGSGLMRIIVTDTGFIWNHKNPALEQFKDAVTVVCLNGKKVTDMYECFVTNYKQVGMGMDNYGVSSQRYKALEKMGDKLNINLGYHEDIIFLTDYNPESLYAFSVICKRNSYNSLHLCAMSPWNFAQKHKKEGYRNLLNDLSSLKSLLYINSDSIMAAQNKVDSLKNLIAAADKYYSDLLPRILYGIQEMQEVSYFDFNSMKYVPINAGYDEVDLSAKLQEIDVKDIEAYRMYCTLGMPMLLNYPGEEEYTKESVEALVPRLDGKKICNYLRMQRLALAEANGISFESEECPSYGPCAGTCRKCDTEAQYLKREIEKIAEEKRIYPAFSINEMEGM